MDCNYTYKDLDGNISAVYTEALKKYGKEKAEQIYIQYMLPRINTRFSKGTLTESVSATQGNIETIDNHTGYKNKQNGQTYDSVTTLLQSYIQTTETVPTFLSGPKVVDKLQAGLNRQAREYLRSALPVSKLPIDQRSLDEIDAYIAKNTDKTTGLCEDFELAKKDVQALWDAQNVEGTNAHWLLAKVLSAYDARVGETGLPVNESEALTIAYKVIQEIKDKGGEDARKLTTSEGRFKYTGKEVFNALLPIVKDAIEIGKTPSVDGKPSLIRYSPETEVYTDLLKDPNSTRNGTAGTIDLLAMTDDKRHVNLYDFKTIGVHKGAEYDKYFDMKIGGPFAQAGLATNKGDMAKAQEMLYGNILRIDPKYNIAVTQSSTIGIPLRFHNANAMAAQPLGNAKWEAIEMQPAIVINKQSILDDSSFLPEYFQSKGLTSVNTLYDIAREKGISGITEKWSGETEDGTPQATFSKYHKKAFIEGRLNSKRSGETAGTFYVHGFDGKAIDVTGKTDDEIRTILGTLYEEGKGLQTNIAQAVLIEFNRSKSSKSKNTSNIPKELKNRGAFYATLLRGITPETHTLHLAQNWPGLRGVGPDVLIAKNKRTNAVTLLSAIVTMDTPVKFKSDGSRSSKRTTLLGNYVTDAMLETGGLSDKMLHNPTVHDYIALKLALTALHLKKYYGDAQFSVEGMRVVSIASKDQAVPFKDCDFDEEIEKLRAFEKYAGKDFPDEYRELLSVSDTVNTTGYYLADLMAHIRNNTDPLGPYTGKDLRAELLSTYNKYATDKLVGWQLKKLLGSYVEAVSRKLRSESTKGETALMADPRSQLAARAFLEFMKFDMNVTEFCSDRNTTVILNSAVSSGDKHLQKIHIEQKAANTRILQEMEDFMVQHKRLTKRLLKEKGAEFINSTDKAFANMYKNATSQADIMTLKDPSDPSLSAVEKEYIEFFNATVKKILILCAPPSLRADIENGRFWAPGTVPILPNRPELLTLENFSSVESLKGALKRRWASLQKQKGGNALKAFLEFEFPTQFDDQATDSGVAFSEKRRKALGVLDPNSPKEIRRSDLETNLAAILNIGMLEALEKEHNSVLLQAVAAMQILLAGRDDPRRTGMTSEMLDLYRETVIFNRYKAEPWADALDPINRISSAMLFSFSLRQGMIELSTGTLQTASAAIANALQDAYAAWFGRPEMAGRMSLSNFMWAVKKWGQWDPKYNQIVWDCGMLVADANDMKNAEFYGGNKFDVFKSEAAFALNRVFFNNSITHTFLAQVHQLEIDKAYKYNKDQDRWIYDETEDPRFFAYDPAKNIGTRAPETDDEKKRFSLWTATREDMAQHNFIDAETGRMKVPFTPPQLAEIKLYATRMVGSFSKDNQVVGAYYSIIRAMSSYKKWAFQKVANYYTPTIRNAELYGHYEAELQPDGTYKHVWVGDDFQGILQTLWYMTKEIVALRGRAMMGTLNKYQLENLTKLLSDMLLAVLMFFLALPLVEAIESESVNEETGEITRIKSPFGKSALGTNAYKALSNATADLMFLMSLPGLTETMFPSMQIFATTFSKAFRALGDIAKGEAVDPNELLQSIGTVGMFRTYSSFRDIATNFEEYTK